MQMEHFFPQIQVKTKKKVFIKNRTLFSPNSGEDQKKGLHIEQDTFFAKFTLRCTPIQIIRGLQIMDHSQTIGEIQPNYWGDLSPPCFGTPDNKHQSKITIYNKKKSKILEFY